ncbi:MAG: hypothetical protein R2813_08340 [Flavobacteriales bacterium]
MALLVGALVCSVVFVRGFTTNLNYDAAYTYLHYAYRDLGAFLQIDIANNHPLNSLLMYLSAFVFPFNDLAIRAPALLTSIVYVVLAINTAKIFRMRWLVLALLLGNYAVIEYLGYARGYVFAVTLVLAALFVHLQRERFKEPMWTIVYLLLLAVSAYVPSALILVCFLGYEFMRSPKFVLHQIWVRWLDSGIVLVVLSYFGYVAYRITNDDGKEIFGGAPDSFWESFVGGFIHQMLPQISALSSLMVQLVTLAMLVSMVLIARRSINKAWIGISFLGVVLVFYIRAVFFDQLVPIDRLLVPFWPLVALALGIVVDELFGIRHLSVVRPFVDFGLALILVANLAWQVQWIPQHHYESWLLEEYPPASQVDSTNALVDYYLRKDQLHHIRIKNLMSDSADFILEKGDSIELYVYRDKRIVMTSVKQNLRDVIFLHAYPKQDVPLPAELIQSGFANLDAKPYAIYTFSNRVVKVHHLDDLDWDYLLIGQFNESGRLWTEVLREILSN